MEKSFKNLDFKKKNKQLLPRAYLKTISIFGKS